MENNQDNTCSVLVDKGKVVEASYSPPELPKFGGNPLIEALPLINTRKQAMKLMQRFPKYSGEMRRLPPHLRTHAVMDVLHFFQPLPIHLRLEGMISRVVRDGYLSRNPMDPAYAGTLEERLECFKNERNIDAHFAPTAAGFSILGMSGVGKSTGLRNVLHLYPQIILHNRYQERNFTKAQIVWLKIECPKDGSTKALCLNFFQTLDALLGTTYAKDFGQRRRNTDELMMSMANIAARHHLGLLGIDEIQNLNEAKSGGADEMLNFFVNLINTIGLPVILIGTYDAAHILGGSFRQARRGSGQGDLVWDWMEFDNDWQLFVEALWRLQYVEKECRLTTRLCRALHEISYGVTDLAIRIYLAAQVRVIENGVEEISEGLLRSAYRDDFRLLSYIIEVLKSGDSEAIKKLRDIWPPPKLPVAELSSGPPTSEGVDDQESETQEAHTTRDESLSAIQSFSSPTESKKRGKGNSTIAFEQGDLRGMVTQGALSNPPINSYQSLSNAGTIKPSTEFL